MLTWYKEPYISENLRDTWQEEKKRLDRGEYSRSVWVISIPLNPRDQLDIRRASELGYHGLAAKIPMIVGLADSRREAVKLVERIAGDWAAQGAVGSLRDFLLW